MKQLPILLFVPMVSTAALAAGINLDAPLEPWSMSERIEQEMMASFDASSEPLEPPRHGKRLTGLDLSGRWQSPGGYDSTSFTFEPLAEGSYSVLFRTSGCLGHWELTRKATYSQSTILLDLPVQEYTPATYTRLHTIEYQGDQYLIASARVAMFDEKIAAGDRSVDFLLLLRLPDDE